MHLKYGKQMNYLAILFLLFAFFGYISFATWLSQYASPNIFTMFKGSMWISIALAVIGFRQEKSTPVIMLFGVCALVLIGLYIFAILSYFEHPIP
ncbi:hypothetical protein [Bacillus sp. TL12]|uniref:hypothetical protein n=1 Tax=Bacillus sp. TL12 TaxID=2894756 RepID=UPI001F517B0F|nr:hypothetical protein [Bacillus sp. TL12]MCI0765932.1 hypothetical protein [Bacillus sp. TL12]